MRPSIYFSTDADTRKFLTDFKTDIELAARNTAILRATGITYSVLDAFSGN